MNRIELAGSLSMRDAPELAARLRAAMEDGEPVVIDLSGLESIDTGCLQLLLAGHRQAAETGQPLGFADPSHPPFVQALHGLGFVAPDGSAITPEHAFWTTPLSVPEREIA